MNKDTYTPMEIDGSIYVVKNAPEKPEEKEHWPMLQYMETIEDCTKYPTLEEHAEYWQGKLGQQVEVEIKGGEVGDGGGYALPTYAIPPQQKQDDEDLWDEVQSRFNAWLFEDGEASLDDIFNELKSNYSLKRK